MTFKELKKALQKLEEIADSSVVASELAQKILQKDATAYNVIKIQKLLENYDRNR